MTRLFEMILQTTAGASILVVLVLMLMFALGKKYNQKWRYWVWMFIALRLVLPFDIPHDASLFTFSIPEEKTVITYNPENNVGTQTTPDKIIIPSDITQNIEQTPTHDTRPLAPPTTVTPPSTNDNIIIPVMPDEDVVDVTPTKTISLTQIFAVVWLVGVLGCAVWHIVMHIRFLGRAKLWNRPVTEPWANEIFNNVKKEMGITEDVKLYRNRSVHYPILTGFFKPTVLIPTRNLTENDLYMVLRHELLHYKRHDLWYKLLLVVAGCLHWFNPFVWFMVRRADRDLEIACDEAVVKGESTEFRKDYCETILRIIRCDRGRKPALSTGFTTGKKTMKKRFACALDSTAKRTGIILLCLVLCATIVCSTFIACDITKKDLTKYYDDVLYFAEWIPQTFANTTELENDFVSGYVFRTITSKNEYKEDETGAVHITQSKINEATKLLLGMETFVPDRELWMYYAESDSYAFYPVGEGPMYSGEITSSEEKDGILYFTVKLTQKVYGGTDEPSPTPKVYVITYAFTENDNELYPLKAIKAEYDAEYLASIDVKGIGVLGYVDNAGTLPRHSVELTEKISDANSFMFKKHRVCAYDAARNGYVVHYYDYTEGDDALNLALAVETIVKGSGLKVNTARVEKGFVVVDLLPTGEAVDNIKVKELLESIACTNDTNGYYLTGFTLSGGQFDFGDITLENDGYGKYDFEPLFNQPITELEFATMRNLLKYPFINGIPIYDGTGVAFADSVTDKNEELASLIYYTAECGEYSDFSKLSNKYTAAMGIHMVPDTYDCMMEPEKWSEVVVNSYDYMYLKPLMTVISDFQFVAKEWVELAVKQIWGKDAELIHPSSTLGKWTYHALEGVYTPFHGGEGSKVLPYIHSVTKTADGYVAEVSYVLANIGGVHGWDNGETLLTYDMFDNEEVVELAKRQNLYRVTAKYGDDGKLYLTSCVKKRDVIDLPTESTVVGVSDAERYTYLDTIYVTMTNNGSEEIEVPSYYCLLKETEYGWVKVDFDNAPNTTDASTTRKSGESWTMKLSLYDSFENLESGYYCFAIGTKINDNDGVIPLIVSNKFHIDDRVSESMIVAEDRNGGSWSAATITWVEPETYKATLYVNGVKKEFNFAHPNIILPDGLSGNLSLKGNIATITADYCGMKMTVDFDKNTFDLAYNISSSDIERELDISSTGRYTLYDAGFTGAGDAGYSKVVLYDNSDKSYTYICEGGGMYGGGFEAGFLRNEDFYTTSFGELRIYNPKTKELVLDVGGNLKLGYNEDEKFSRYLLTFRRDPNNFSFIVVYFDLPEGYREVEVNDILGHRTEYSTNYKIGYLDKNGNLIESYDTGMGVWVGRYWTPLEVSMRYSEKELTLIASDGNGYGFTGTFDRTTHKFSTKDVSTILNDAHASIEETGNFLDFAEKNQGVVVSTVEFIKVENYLGFESYAFQESEYELLNTNRMNRFVQNCKSGVADTVVAIKSGSPLPLYSVVLKYDGVSIKKDSYYLRNGELVNITSSETVELFERDSMWVFKNDGEVVDVFPMYTEPYPFSEKGSMTTDEIAKKLESMNKYGFKVKYKGEETVLETQVYRFDYYDQETLMDYIYISKDLQKIFVIDQAHGRIHTVIK